ncbi:TPA: hypothetical protein QC364_004646 [Bacillus cereus]|nr:hypothetical protein bcere0029_54040 [Bacillus cereus AH1272]EEL90524.1 hypothetical protein bcere0030_55510 [Bacillus cereus AH1273]MBL3852947.1 hypothetical protein [Bacillus cereus]NEL02148.1 hypothetical protein [Bacillus mobilis]HDR8320947.1 hypothetical protein [Bacillus cereus]
MHMVYAYLLYVLKNIMQNSKRGAHIMSYHEDDCHDKRERRDKKERKFPLGFCEKCKKSKIECRCCMICAPQPCHCQKQEQNQNQDQDQKQDQDQNQDAIQVPIQTGSELEANQDQKQDQHAIQEGSDQKQEQDQHTIQSANQEGAEVDQDQHTTQNPLIIGPSPDQETSQNTDTTATLNTVVTPTINSDPDTTTTLDTTVTPTVNSDPNTTTTTTLDTTVTPTISSDPNTETNLETTVTPTINSDPNTETTLDTTITPTITSDPTTTTTLDTTVTPTVTNTTETNPTTTQTTNQNPSQMTSQEGQTQEQTEEQNQTQSQTAGDQLQAQGFQLIEGHTNDSPLNNSQTISTTVSGVTVNVNVECGCNEKKHHKEEREECNECDCCTKSFARLLQLVQTEQASIPLPIDSQISIYTNTPLSIGNPIPNQILTNVNDCVSVTFKNAGQATPVPNTTLQIKKVAGISAVNDTTTTDDIFDFLLGIANNCSQFQIENKDCNCDDICDCKRKSCCFTTFRTELETIAALGLQINLLIEGLSTSIDNVFVSNICDCLGFFVDNLTTPTIIYVFSLCSISGYTVPSQTI